MGLRAWVQRSWQCELVPRPAEDVRGTIRAFLCIAAGLMAMNSLPTQRCGRGLQTLVHVAIGTVISIPCCLQLEPNRQQIRRLHVSDTSSLCLQYWFTSWTPLSKLWPSPWCVETVLDCHLSTDERVLTEISLGTKWINDNDIQGIRLDWGAMPTTVTLLTGPYSSRTLHLRSGDWHVLPRFGWYHLSVTPIEAVNHLQVKCIDTPEDRWSAAFSEDDIRVFHEEVARVEAVKVDMYKKELVAKACHPSRVINTLDVQELQEVISLHRDTQL